FSPRAACLCLAFSTAPVIAAQSPSTQVPPALVSALLAIRNSGTATNVQYFVGTPPPGWSSAGLPPIDAPVIGGLSADGALVTVFSDSARRVSTLLRERLDSAGWTQPDYGANRGGFVDVAGPMVRFVSGTVCHGSSSASAYPGRGNPFGSSDLVVSVQAYNPSCDTAEIMRRMPRGLPIPLLVAPPQTRWRGGNSDSNTDDVMSSAQFQDSATPVSVLLAHFSAQLIAAGWTAAESAERDRFAARMFDVRDKEGHEWAGALTVTAAGNVRVASVIMTRKNPSLLR
nr:hypothetical protein [Gemmatimonadota bacterium]